MKVTMYELLGMVKDGTAPKKIKYDSVIYIYDEIREDYYDKVNDKYFINMFFNRFKARFALVKKIEIIEEPQEHKIPEKICINRIINTKDILEFEMIQNKINAEYTYAINKILDYLGEIK